MKKTILVAVFSVFIGGSIFAAQGDRGLSLIVAPARYSVLQVMFDVIKQREAVLVSYQGQADTEAPMLHVWNGAAWDPIKLHDLREVSFLNKSPSRAILIGNDDLLPSVIRDALAWMPELVTIRQLENATLLNELGRILKWNKHEWNWFSTRYNLQLEDEAAPLRKSSWYDQSGPLPRQVVPAYEPVPVIRQGRQGATPVRESLDSDIQPANDDVSHTPVPVDTLQEGPEYDDEISDIVDALERSQSEKATASPETK